jgi:HEAT repeat protein
MIERVERNEQISPVTEKYTDVFPPKLRVAMIMGEPEGFLDLAVALGWAGAQMAADVCRLLLGDKVELPSYEPDHIVRWFRGNADSLVRLLAHGDPAIRATAVELAGRFKVESVAQEVTRLLDDPDTTVVKAAIRALVNLGSVPPADVFTERLKAKDACVRLTAVKALVDLEQVHEAAGSLAQLLADPDERVFDAAVSTLESAKELDALGSRAVDLVRSGRNAETRTWAARILSKHHDFPTPEDVLIDMLNDDLIEVRCAAAMILASRSDWRALPVLREGIAAREVPQDYLFVAADMEKG